MSEIDKLKSRSFRKIEDDHWIGGVAAGLAYKLGVKTWIIRLLWAAALCYYGVGLGIYILLWIFVPSWDQDPEDYQEISG
ncbi:PspC domain-containing protein [Candidatus Parcubacteria bacterium]|jgi:phage shock protein PspC (stress-responsive transcriptional regulator)|nr:PspC domain-containing protein [Candidatus Parcubacteria bacterium]MBT7228556.1 PspC domain-containing protein [Candidatus Parcubacteria bacterium]